MTKRSKQRYIYVIQTSEDGVVAASSNARNAAQRALELSEGSLNKQPTLRRAAQQLATQGYLTLSADQGDHVLHLSITRFVNL